MTGYIKYSSVEDAIKRNTITGVYHPSEILEIIERNIKSEEVYPIVHARWIDLDDDFLCSACGAPWWHKENCTDKFRFCPNCGAKMDLE